MLMKDINDSVNESIDENRRAEHNNLVSLVRQYNLTPNAHNNKKYEIYKKILNKTKNLGYQINSIKNQLVVLFNDKPIKTIANRTSSEDIKSKPLLSEYPEDFQEFVRKLISFGDLKLHNIDVNADLDVAQKDILNNKKSISANNTLDSLETMFDRNVINIKATKSTPSLSIPIPEYFEIFQANIIDDEDDFWDAHFNNIQENLNKIDNMLLTNKKVELITNLVLEKINYSKALENMIYRKRDPKFFSEKYIEWNSQGRAGYNPPTEKSVFEFLQNNYEDLSHEDELIGAILRKLKNINESKKNDNKLNKFLQKVKELVIDEDSYRLINHYNFNKLDGWPDITYGEGGEHPDKIKDGLKSETQTLDLENFEFLKLNDKELQFMGGGDWQYPYTVTVKLVGDKLKVVDSRPYDKKLDKGRSISANDIIKILDAEDLQKAANEKEAKKKAEQCIKQTKEMDFWKNWNVNEILSGIRKNNEYLSQWTLVSKYIKEYVKNNNPMKNENNTTTNLENLIESIVKPLIEGKSNDYMKAIKKADRELEYELNGPGWKSKDRPHKNHKNYDRKRDKKVNIDEASTNLKKINLTLTDIGLNKFKKIPTFNNLLTKQQVENLVVGDNILTVNHYIYSTINRVSGYDPENIVVKDVFSEATYSFDSEDPNLQQKTDKLKNDTTLFNKDKDEIKINTESKKIVLTKDQIMEMNQLRQLNKKNIFTKNQIIEMLKKKMI